MADLSLPWSHICPVNVEALQEFCLSARWPEVAANKPPRIFDLPGEIVASVVQTVMVHLPGMTADRPFLSLMRPWIEHGMHVDQRNSGWVTRVHVVVKTNRKAWMLWEEDGVPVFFQEGWAYTFHTTRRHAFGNGGTADRIHLIFDVKESL